MPSSNTASPVKRVVSQQPSSDPSIPPGQPPSTSASVSHSHKAVSHKPNRPHVVALHRTHGRNSSHKSLNKLQRLSAAHILIGEGDAPTPPALRQHHRKKSVPEPLSASLRAGHHVRWNGSTVSLGGNASNLSMKRNLSTPVLRRNGSGILVKRSLLQNKAAGMNRGGRKKTVGFELTYS